MYYSFLCLYHLYHNMLVPCGKSIIFQAENSQTGGSSTQDKDSTKMKGVSLVLFEDVSCLCLSLMYTFCLAPNMISIIFTIVM